MKTLTLTLRILIVVAAILAFGASVNTTKAAFDIDDYPPSATLAKSATPSIYSAVGQVITYKFTFKNTSPTFTFLGNTYGWHITDAIEVMDSKLGSFECAPAGDLAPGDSVSCTKTYTIQASDLNATFDKTITNTATATVYFYAWTFVWPEPLVVTSNTVTVNQVKPTAAIVDWKTTCAQFAANNPSAPTLVPKIKYVAVNGRIYSAIPFAAIYFTAVQAPAANFTVVIQQTNPKAWRPLNFVTPDYALYNSTCNRIANPFYVSGASATMPVKGATPGDWYFFAARYSPLNLALQMSGLTYPDVPYLFKTLVNGKDNLTGWSTTTLTRYTVP